MISRRSLIAASGSMTIAVLASGASARLFFDAKRHPLGLNLYVVSGLVAKDPVGTLQAVARIGYREVETGLEGHDAATLAAAIKEAGLACSSLNLLPKPLRGGRSLADDAGLVAQDAHRLGAAYVTCTLFPLPQGVEMRPQPGESTEAMLARVAASVTKDDWKRTADWLNRKGAALKQQGVALAYHNHNPEFAPRGETNGLSILLEHTDPALVHFHMDAGWVVAGGQDPVTILRAWPGRFRLMHVKDVAPSYHVNSAISVATTEVGTGIIDWARVLPAARAAGVQHFAVEQEPPYILPPLESAAKSFAWLDALDIG
ncbi:MAG TPA: sugar phosphate isomerase/epimerase [Sphingobium sp.]|uniref:sugar phosphate isomerase/epimerase family protein n=1 Tax=Sphingobium sp. TaxID=1912891 RepID=UPI002ED1E108